VILPAGLLTIGDSCFYQCLQLNNLILPDGLTGIGESAFQSCFKLTSITLPDSLTSLGNSAFSACTGLTSVTLSANLATIGSSAFIVCSNLTSVTIPASVTSIGNSAFQYCNKLERADFLGNAPTMGTGVFSFTANTFTVYYSYYSNQTGFTQPTWSGYNVANLNEFTYTTNAGEVTITGYPDTAVGTLTIPDTLDGLPVVEIGDQAFQNCAGLTGITLPSGVTRIGSQAFQNCSKVTTLDIPAAVTSLGSQAFQGCAALTGAALPSGLTHIPLGLLQDCGALASVTIPVSVTSIGEFAFKGCSALTAITLPANLTSIGDSAFQNCSGLTTLSIPSKVTSIGNYAFAFCSGLETIAIPSGVTVIRDHTFYYCDSLSKVTLPNSITAIGAQAFFACGNLTSVVIPASVTDIGDEAFGSCTSLGRADFLGNAPSMGTDVFTDTAAGFTANHTKNATGFDVAPWTDYNVAVNNLPVANARTATTVKNTAVPIAITGKDPDGNPLTYTIATLPTKGTLTGTPPKLTYTPNTNYTGTDSFTFTVSDGKVASAAAKVSITIGSAPPLPWDTDEIGTGKLAGSTIFKSAIFTQAGAGAFGTTSDKLRFTHQTLSGDGEIIARISALEKTGTASRVGVMMRDSLATNAPHVFIGLTDNGDYRFVNRTTKGAKNETSNSGSADLPDGWVKLVREGNDISAYKSTNGTKWTLVETVVVKLAKNCYVGLVVASGNDTKLNTSQFSNVKVKP
jgi:hypothetical protein